MAEMECEFPQPLGRRSRKRHRTLQPSRRGARHPGEPDGGGQGTTLTGMPWGTLWLNGFDNQGGETYPHPGVVRFPHQTPTRHTQLVAVLSR